MDYEDEEPDNLLLFYFALFALAATISGLFLTYFRLLKGRLKQRKNLKQQKATEKQLCQTKNSVIKITKKGLFSQLKLINNYNLKDYSVEKNKNNKKSKSKKKIILNLK